jgi:hypothetical protein
MPLSYRQGQNLFVAGPNIGIYPSGNSIAISGSASLGTLVTGLTSAGTGNFLILSSITNNTTTLVQKSISATGISIIDSEGTLTFSGTVGTVTSGQNIGTGFAIFTGISNNNLVFRRLVAGGNLTIYTSATSPNDIIISATTGAISGITGLTNLGGGIAVTSSITNNILISRTISGSNGIEVVESDGLVLIRPSTGLTPNRFIIAGTGGAFTTNEFFQADTVQGGASIGFTTPQTLTNTRLLLAAATTTVTPLVMPISTLIGRGGNRNGDIQYFNQGNTLYFFKGLSGFDGIASLTPFIFRNNNQFYTGVTNNRVLLADNTGSLIPSNIYFTPLGIFNSLTSTTISGTSELSILNTGFTAFYGTNILNSSLHGSTPQLIYGKKYRFNAKGTISTQSSAGDLIARMKLGSVLVASSTTTLANSISSKYFEIDCTFTIRNQGSGGTVFGSGKMLTDNQYLASLTSPIAPITALGGISGVTLATTVDTAFDFTLQNTSNANNTYIINEATLEFLN